MEPKKDNMLTTSYQEEKEEEMEIWVVPFFGQGHLLPSMELCKHLASRNLKTTLILTSNLSSSVPSSFLRGQNHHLLQVLLLPEKEFEQPAGQHGPPRHDQMGEAMETLVQARSSGQGSGLPVCAVVDVMMSWTREVFSKFRVPVIGFLTSGACNAAMEYATWKEKVPGQLEPGVTRLLDGLPEEMALTHADLKRRPHGPPGGGPPHGLDGPPHGPPGGGPPPGLDGPPGGSPGGGPPPGLGGPPRGQPGGFLHPPPFAGPGQKRAGPPELGHAPPWLEETEGMTALLINTCHELEGPFLEYLTREVGKPVWGVGPLLPEQYWKSAGSIFHDREFRSNRRSNVTEEEVVSWLDSKPRGSVLYVSFGTEVGPENEELSQLADALEETNRPFIWVIQPNSGRPGPPPQHTGDEPGSVRPERGYSPNGLGQRVGDRGLIIEGWAPQLLILSHPSTGGFLSHCGWNSTAEAIGRGVPILVWPIRGDQYFNGGLVVKYLRVGCMISDDMSRTVKKDDIVKGIERLLGDEDVKKRAMELSGKFEGGFPRSSLASLDALKEFIITHKED